jgi:hypothetical protein
MRISFPLRLAAVALVLSSVLTMRAQLATLYSAGASQRTFALINGGQLLAGPVFDDGIIYTTVPTFFFNGSYYSDMHVSTNGFITVGAAATGTTYTPISGTGTYLGAISPFGANLKNATSGTPEIRWEQVGTELVIQWRDVARQLGVNERFSFQTRIDVNTGQIRFIYSAVTDLNSLATQQPQVGLRGPTNVFATNVKNFQVNQGAETWLTPLAGTGNANAMRFTTTAVAKFPLGGEALTFVPGCLSPVATATVESNCAANNYTVSVNISSLGTAASANITASPGGTLHSAVGTGTYVCGPFTLGTAVTLNVVHSGNAGCTSLLGTFNPTPTCTTMTSGVCILDPPYPQIPDNGCATGNVLQASIPMSGLNTTLGSAPGQTLFQALEVIVAHTYRGDISVKLTSPTGQTRTMFANVPTPQAAGSNFGNPGACPGVVLQLRDVGGLPLSGMDPDLNNISGIYTPQQSLSGFTGNPNGNWILTVCDGSLEDAGSLRFVRLRLLNVDCAGTPGGTALPGAACNDGNPNTTGDVYGANCVCAGTGGGGGVNVSIKGFLEGPYVSGTGLMNDGLRSGGLIPASEPYTALGFTQVTGGGETVAPAVLTVTGNNAIVDWVLVELRNAANNTQITRTRCGLIQRDGDVVDVNGTSALAFSGLAAGNYFVTLRHRNHFGVMTSGPISLSSTPGVIDFSLPATSTFGTAATKLVGSAQCLWAGNARRDINLLYTGSNNDRDPILVAVGSTTPNNTVGGYLPTDVNMDGTVKYTGSANDRDPILVNVGSTTPNNVRSEQLP